MKGYTVPHLVSMTIQIWKFENNFGLATFYGYLLKNMSCHLFQVDQVSKMFQDDHPPQSASKIGYQFLEHNII